MSLKQQLLDKIDSALSASISPNLTTASQGDDLYEAYIWSIILEAAQNRGAAIAYYDVNGMPVSRTFIFRTSPSELWWNSQNYCHAHITFNGCPDLEAHVGIYVAGRSNVRHECDVAVLHKSEADLCRFRQVLPRASKVLLSVEAKYYVNSTPGLGLGRAFLGLCNEIQRNNRFFLATSHSQSVAKLLSKHTRDCDLEFSPSNPHNVDVIRSAFEKVFDSYIAQNR